MIATPPAQEPQFVAVTAIVFPPEGGKTRLDAPCPHTPGQSLPTCGVPPHLVNDIMSARIEASSAHSTINSQPRGTIPDQSTTIGIGQDSRSALRPQHPLVQPLPKTLDPIPGRHVERTWGSVNPTVARLVVNESLENSECNIPTDLQHAANRTPSIRDLDDLGSKGKEKAIPRDQTEDVTRKGTRTSTRTQLIEGLWELLRGSRDKNGHGYPHSSPQYGAGSFAQPHTNPTPGTSRSSDGTLPLPPEYKIPSAYVTNVHHHYHYHYNTPNASTPPIINNNIVRINNKNTSNGSDGCESGDDEESTTDQEA